MMLLGRLPILAAIGLSVIVARAEDVVHVAIGENTRTRTRLTGEILDYTGKTLLVRLPGGIERAFPADRVYSVETTRLAEHEAANKLFDQQQFAAALSQYQRAMEKEQRRWVRREILARIVSCHHELGETNAAVQSFMLLVESDPYTPHFDCIPLPWLPGQTSPAVIETAAKWMARQDDPVAALLGASHLLMSVQRTAAAERLRGLSFHSDTRVASLARAQMWRVSFATASEGQLTNWSADVEKMPEALRAGPYFVLGSALAARQQPGRAALAYLRVPIHYPQNRALAGRALLEAGRELERIGQKPEAATLYREVISTHARTPLAEEAEQRLSGVLGSSK
jgi:tetratricopeptide (TPR) repeat protein